MILIPDRLLIFLWLVVPRRHHVWDADRLPSFLFGKPHRDVQENHVLEKYAHISAGSSHLRICQGDHQAVLLRRRQEGQVSGGHQGDELLSSGSRLGTHQVNGKYFINCNIPNISRDLDLNLLKTNKIIIFGSLLVFDRSWVVRKNWPMPKTKPIRSTACLKMSPISNKHKHDEVRILDFLKNLDFNLFNHFLQGTSGRHRRYREEHRRHVKLRRLPRRRPEDPRRGIRRATHSHRAQGLGLHQLHFQAIRRIAAIVKCFKNIFFIKKK